MSESEENSSAEDEAEQRLIDEMKLTIESALVQMQKLAEIGLSDRCEEVSKHLIEILKNPKLPKDFEKLARAGVNKMMLNAYMKATALAAKAAIDAAMEDDHEKRSEKIKEARTKLSGAMKYKASREFKQKCELMLETAMFTGGVKAKGPTVAKPLDTAPKIENTDMPAESTPEQTADDKIPEETADTVSA